MLLLLTVLDHLNWKLQSKIPDLMSHVLQIPCQPVSYQYQNHNLTVIDLYVKNPDQSQGRKGSSPADPGIQKPHSQTKTTERPPSRALDPHNRGRAGGQDPSDPQKRQLWNFDFSGIWIVFDVSINPFSKSFKKPLMHTTYSTLNICHQNYGQLMKKGLSLHRSVKCFSCFHVNTASEFRLTCCMSHQWRWHFKVGPHLQVLPNEPVKNASKVTWRVWNVTMVLPIGSRVLFLTSLMTCCLAQRTRPKCWRETLFYQDLKNKTKHFPCWFSLLHSCFGCKVEVGCTSFTWTFASFTSKSGEQRPTVWNCSRPYRKSLQHASVFLLCSSEGKNLKFRVTESPFWIHKPLKSSTCCTIWLPAFWVCLLRVLMSTKLPRGTNMQFEPLFIMKVFLHFYR